jgi:hypothetical protein
MQESKATSLRTTHFLGISHVYMKHVCVNKLVIVFLLLICPLLQLELRKVEEKNIFPSQQVQSAHGHHTGSAPKNS